VNAKITHVMFFGGATAVVLAEDQAKILIEAMSTELNSVIKIRDLGTFRINSVDAVMPIEIVQQSVTSIQKS
jgi:hypothetical protein